MSKKFEEIEEYILELDALKRVDRKSYVANSQRLENSAEHSWHLAICSWSLTRTLNLDLSEEKLIKLALVHDLGEIDAGDTYLYSENREEAPVKEKECIDRLGQLSGNGIKNLSAIWEEQEIGSSREAKFLKVVDRLLPLILNIANNGKTWKDLKITKTQVRQMHSFINEDYPEIHKYICSKIDFAVNKGWLVDE